VDVDRTTEAFRASLVAEMPARLELDRAYTRGGPDDFKVCEAGSQIRCDLPSDGVFVTVTRASEGEVEGEYVVYVRAEWGGEQSLTGIAGFEMPHRLARVEGEWRVVERGSAKVFH
jgi:hypothetical protein